MPFTFDERIRGSHHIFSKVGVEEIQIRRVIMNRYEVIIKEWIEAAKSLGREIPKPKGRLIFA
ncbi:MAG: hypothetical protein QME25_07630 [Bacteroidota bacterium]|nr:hypothetical protein [Bacteroidota bacterium]